MYIKVSYVMSEYSFIQSITMQNNIIAQIFQPQKKVMLLFPPGGACNFTDDFSVVGPELFPETTLYPNKG